MNKIFFLTALILVIISCNQDELDNRITAVDFELDQVYSINPTNDGGYLIAGVSDSKITLIKTDENFSQQWIKNDYAWGNNDYTGGYYNIRIVSVFQNEAGNYLCFGYSIEGDVFYPRTLIVELDQEGRELRNREFYIGSLNGVKKAGDGYLMIGDKLVILDQDMNVNREMEADNGLSMTAAVSTMDGGYLAVGSQITGPGNIYLMKFNEGGQKVWGKYIACDGTNSCNQKGTDICRLDDGNFLIAGYVIGNDYDCFLYKLDSTGSLIWAQTYSNAQYEKFNHILSAGNNQYVVEGKMNYPDVEFRAFLVKADFVGRQVSSCLDEKLILVEYDPQDVFILARKTGDHIITISKVSPSIILN
jgi:hypothetical protein